MWFPVSHLTLVSRTDSKFISNFFFFGYLSNESEHHLSLDANNGHMFVHTQVCTCVLFL